MKNGEFAVFCSRDHSVLYVVSHIKLTEFREESREHEYSSVWKRDTEIESC